MTAHVHTPAALTVDDKARLGRRAQLLAGASVAYNLVEAVLVGLGAGALALLVGVITLGVGDRAMMGEVLRRGRTRRRGGAQA